MAIKTVCTYWCTFFTVLIIIISLATNYWHEYDIKTRKKLDNGDEPTYPSDGEPFFNVVNKHRAGLWEKCEEVVNYKLDEDEDEVEIDSTELGCVDYDPPTFVKNYEIKRTVLVVCYIIALLATLIAFIFVTVYCTTGKYYFPVGRSAICYFIAALSILIGLLVYTDMYFSAKVSFSWSYGAGWSAVVMYIITIVLMYADK